MSNVTLSCDLVYLCVCFRAVFFAHVQGCVELPCTALTALCSVVCFVCCAVCSLVICCICSVLCCAMFSALALKNPSIHSLTRSSFTPCSAPRTNRSRSRKLLYIHASRPLKQLNLFRRRRAGQKGVNNMQGTGERRPEATLPSGLLLRTSLRHNPTVSRSVAGGGAHIDRL